MDNIKKVKKIYFILISGLGFFSALMIFAAWYSSSIAPKLMEQNYASIQYNRQMEIAFLAIYMAESAGQPLDSQKTKSFEDNFNKAKDNITEEGEKEILENIEYRWNNFKKKTSSPVLSEFEEVMQSLADLNKINERGMYSLNEKARSLGLTIVTGGILGLVLILMYALLIADSQFERLNNLNSPKILQ